MTIYDLHCHSTASDGVLSPAEVVSRAHEKGVHVLALTDHDTIAGLTEARQQADVLGLRLINGVEISTDWEGKNIHIVGLNFDQTHPKLTALLRHQAELREKRAVEIGLKFEKLGIVGAYAGAKQFTDGEVTRAHYARFLVENGIVTNMNQAFKRYLSQGQSCYVKTDWVNIPTAIETIHAAGGKAVLAHPLRYTLTNRRMRKLIGEFAQWGGDGLEAAGCGQTRDQRQLLARWALEANLKVSVGSDFHFPCAWIELGRVLTVADCCQPIWQDFA